MFGLAALDMIILFCYLVLIALIGLWSRKKIKSIGDYFMGNRSFGKILMIAQTFGTATHTAQPVSVAGASYTSGLSGIWYQWMWLFSTPFYWLLAPVYRRLRYLTLADFFKERYGEGMALLYTIFGLLYFCMNIGLVLKGAGAIMSGITDGAIPPVMSISLITILFVLYGVLGGLHAIVIADLIQSVQTLLMSFMILPFAVFKTGGLRTLHSGLPEHMFDLLAPGEMSFFFVSMIILNGLVGIVVHPHHMAMNGSGKTEIACRIGWTFGTFLKRFSTIGWAFIGVFTAFLFPGLVYENRELAFGIAAKNLLPSGLIGLMLTALITAGMSTCDGFMVHASALLTKNIYGVYINPKASEAIKLRIGRFFSVGVVFGGIYFAFAFDSVVQGLMTLLKISSFLGISFWAGVIWKKANRHGAFWSAFIMAVTVVYTDHFLGWPLSNQIALYLVLGTLIMIIVSIMTRPEPEKQMTQFYALLDTPVGREQRLHDAGIEIVLEGSMEQKRPKKTKTGFGLESLLKTEEDGLFIVDCLSLSKRFTWARYRTDILGFLVALLIVVLLVVILLILANIGK